MSTPTSITFFDYLLPLIIKGNKTITIRDASESHFVKNTNVEVYPLGSTEKACDITILEIERIHFNDINEFHAKQEGFPLAELKALIKKVYPDTNELFVITFELIA